MSAGSELYLPQNLDNNQSTPSVTRRNTPRTLPQPVAAELPDAEESSYHGPPSALFDSQPPRLQEQETTSDYNKASESWQRHYLVAQSAKQRELAPIVSQSY